MKPRYAAGIALAALLSGQPVLAQELISTAAVPPPPPEEHPFDPLRAEKSMEVGRYYLKKHNFDAAIERFQDAAKARENFAEPYLLLGETYEQKGDKTEAVKAYESYLKILPNGPESERVRKRTAKLNQQIEKSAGRKPRP